MYHMGNVEKSHNPYFGMKIVLIIFIEAEPD
jgi:hypothetical protein